MRYATEKHSNGKYLVIDTKSTGCKTVAAGMTKEAAESWAHKLNTRAEMVAAEAVKFYADKKCIGVKDVLWALKMGNDKVAKDIAKLIAVGVAV